MDNQINMLTTQEIQELMDIRKQMDALQSRYDTIMKRAKATKAPHSEPPAPSAAQSPAVPVTTPGKAATFTPPVTTAPRGPSHPPAAETKAPSLKLTPVPGSSAIGPAKTHAAKEPGSPASPAPATAPDPLAEKKTVPIGNQDSLRSAIASILKASDKPLTFEEIYKKMEEQNVEMPKDKPKLVVRKILYSGTQFKVLRGGQFVLDET